MYPIEQLNKLLGRLFPLLETITKEPDNVRHLSLRELFIIEFATHKIAEILQCLGCCSLPVIMQGIPNNFLHLSLDSVDFFVVNFEWLFMCGQETMAGLVQDGLGVAQTRVLFAQLARRGLVLAVHVAVCLQDRV
jgi:hypothetical protein